MILKKFALKSLVSIFILLQCRFEIISGAKVHCSSNQTDICEVFEPINGIDESITVVTTPEQDHNTINGIRLMDVSDEIPSKFFQLFPGIQFAEFKAGVKAISKMDFQNAKNLIDLDLAENRLKVIPKEVFAHAIELDRVDLSSNSITDIEDYAFSGATVLATLILNKNNLTIIRKATFAGAPSLNRLEVQENQIEVVEEGAFDIPSLELIFLESNRVKRLPDNIFRNAPKLDIAYFESNGMTEIGKAFFNLKLGSVAFRHNQLKGVDLYEFVKSNPLMRNLYMEDTGFQFKNSPEQGETFPNVMRCLYLTNNSIPNTNVLEHLEAFKDLEYLDIAFNNITRIDGIETIKQKFPKIVAIMYPGNPLNCSWIESTPFDRKLLTFPRYHRSDFNDLEYSQVDGIYCKK